MQGPRAEQNLGGAKIFHVSVIFPLRPPTALRKSPLTEDDATLNGGTKEAEAATKIAAINTLEAKREATLKYQRAVRFVSSLFDIDDE